MGRDATKAAGNPWYQARKKAAEYDDRLCSRESAAEQLGMSVSSLADAELGNTKFMPVDKAVLMADRYNAPWLLNHYCLNECPIGCRHSLSDEVVGIDRVTVKLLKSLKTEQLGEVKDTLLDIAADGKITEDEKPALQEVLTYLDDLAKTVSELKTIGEMALNEDGDAHGSKYRSWEENGEPRARRTFQMDMTVEVPELPELTFDEASHIYRLNGDIIPSVSKLMEPLKDQCYGGISKRTLENAAIKGSAVHNSIENWIKFGIDDIPSEHRGYFNGFMEWWKQYKPRVFGSEVRIYHKASDAWHYTEHYQASVWDVDPRDVCRGRPVGGAWFSPDCKHFSKAKGAALVDKKIRGLAWITLRWAALVRPRVIFLENVEEFQTWGPVRKGKPVKKLAGTTFRKFIGQLRDLGYAVEWRELVAADYGAPTSRKRFVLIARCDGKPIVWPEPTHAPRDSEAVKSGRLKPWRSAAEIIDWSLPCPSIFDTKEEIKERYGLKAVRPLADNTMRRIIRGVDKFTIRSGEPFIVQQKFQNAAQDIENPLTTVTAVGAHELCKPVLAPFTATNTSNSVGAPAGDPVHTVTTAGNQMLVTPYLAECNHAGGGHVADVRGPYKTITAKHTGGIVAPSLIQYHTEQTENVRASGLGAPIPTVDASNRYGLTCANLVKYYSGVVGEKMEEPLPTVTAIDHNAVCAAHVVKFKGDNLGSSPAEPMQTVTAGAGQKKACGGGTFALCDTLLCKAGPDENLYRWPLIRELLNRYCGYKLADDDLLLLSIGGTLYFIADIGLRMLSPRELYNAMGFPPDYIIDRDYMGNPYPKNEQVARCGNAVCPPMAAAVARANFPEYVAKVGDTITTMAALLDMVAV